MAWNDRSKRFPRVEDRPDFREPVNPDDTLDRLELGMDDCALKDALSPKYIHARLLAYYAVYPELQGAEARATMTRVWNLSRPVLHQVIRRFRRTLDIYPEIRAELMCECSIVVARVYKERRYDAARGTMLTSYLFDLFRYCILGTTSRYFKEKKKYIPVDPHRINDVCSFSRHTSL